MLGILGLVILPLLSPFAWVIGGKAVREIDASQGALGGRQSAQIGYVLGIVGTVILVLIVVIFVAFFGFFGLVLLGLLTAGRPISCRGGSGHPMSRLRPRVRASSPPAPAR